MKKHISITRLLAFCMVLIITFVLTQLSNAGSTSAPGSTGDPLITKSYVDGKVTSLNTKISNLTKDLESAEAALKTANDSIKTLKTQIATLIAAGGGDSFNYKTVKKGTTLVLKEGDMAIVYTGVANVVGKLADLTDGKALNTNQLVTLRHLIASAVSDTRGIKAKTDITVLTTK